MKKNISLLVKFILIAFFIAGLPSNAINENYITVGRYSNASMMNPIMNPLGSGYNLGNLPVISLSGVSPEIFNSASFFKEPGGLSSYSLYTSSISNFLKGDKDAGISKIARKPARLGMLMGWGQNITA